ncbi:hypothetical protein [Gordonia insulae]|uniref:hypothetical protein n=1 Tax=Gordonia insulae TaxID=2420509 RepID=UPI002F95CFF4
MRGRRAGPTRRASSSVVESEPRIQAFLWFQMDKERDWRFNSTAQSLQAFRASVAAMLSKS